MANITGPMLYCRVSTGAGAGEKTSPDSPQAVAYALLERIAAAEDWSGSSSPNARWTKSQQEILDTYKQCLEAVLEKYRR